MKLTKLTSALSKVTGRTGLALKKHSPEILLVVGITGTVASAVLACKATLKVEKIIRNHKSKVESINNVWESIQAGDISTSEYSEQDRKKDLTIAYVQTAVGFVKLYGPAVTLGAASIACLLGGHRIMKKRNVALVAAYKAVEESFNAYRQRVKDDFGEEKDYIYKNGLKSETVTEIDVGEDGKPIKVKKTKLNADDATPSMYARFFDETSTEWSKTPEYNLLKLRAEQNYMNDLLKTRGHVFLNEVYDTLGLERSQAGAAVGWVFDKDKGGDNFIDFGVFDGDTQRKRDFVNGYERAVLLDFNVDGVIWDLI